MVVVVVVVVVGCDGSGGTESFTVSSFGWR